MPEVTIDGRRVKLSPGQVIGKGGEADIYDLGQGLALKLFKSPRHPDLQGQQMEQQAAKLRLQQHQTKLPAFPAGLPSRVIQPLKLAMDARNQKVVGYVMTKVEAAEVLLRYSERSFRSAGVATGTVVDIFRDLHATVGALHQAGIVIGDFNDLNVLVRGTQAFVIDADSFAYQQFLCTTFMAKFVDPLLCDPRFSTPMLVRPHTVDSDWYAFAVMLMQSLLFTGPYGGVYRPADTTKRMGIDARPLHRITVWHPEVRYPKPAAPFEVLPDELLAQLMAIFKDDQRGEFPDELLAAMRWQVCPQCGLEHARARCPACLHQAPVVNQTVTIRGSVTAREVFRAPGAIVYATLQRGKPRWLYHDGASLKREDGDVVAVFTPEPGLRYRISGNRSFVAKGQRVLEFQSGCDPKVTIVDTANAHPAFGANESGLYWADRGALKSEGRFGPTYIGQTLTDQTRFWVGPTFGVGFYRAGELTKGFVFDARKPGINDTVPLPPFSGQLVDATCYFGQDAWLMLTVKQGAQLVNHCYVISPTGEIRAQAEELTGSDTWLGYIHAIAAGSRFALAASDEGVMQVEISGGALVVTGHFPDTKPFVATDSQLLLAPDGLYVFGRQTIHHLTIK